jgi:hypothetical protein
MLRENCQAKGGNLGKYGMRFREVYSSILFQNYRNGAISKNLCMLAISAYRPIPVVSLNPLKRIAATALLTPDTEGDENSMRL